MTLCLSFDTVFCSLFHGGFHHSFTAVLYHLDGVPTSFWKSLNFFSITQGAKGPRSDTRSLKYMNQYLKVLGCVDFAMCTNTVVSKWLSVSVVCGCYRFIVNILVRFIFDKIARCVLFNCSCAVVLKIVSLVLLWWSLKIINALIESSLEVVESGLQNGVVIYLFQQCKQKHTISTQ